MPKNENKEGGKEIRKLVTLTGGKEEQRMDYDYGEVAVVFLVKME